MRVIPKSPHADSAFAMARTAGFDNVSMLRDAAESLSDPSELAELFELDTAVLAQLLEEVELASIHGIGKTYLALLQSSGISTIYELCKADPFELHAAIKIAAQRHSVARRPNRATIEYWIEQAQALRAKADEPPSWK